jgi:hypothetical protein
MPEMFKRLWAIIKAFYYTPVAATESQPKENTVKLEIALLATGALANGTSANTVQATLTDATGAVLPNAVVSFTADNGAVATPASALTDQNGQISVSLVSSTVGPATLYATAVDSISGSGTSTKMQVDFVAVPASEIDMINDVEPYPPEDQDLTKKALPAALSPLEALKDDFNKVVAFIEHGIEVLGKDAEADLVALKNKFIV